MAMRRNTKQRKIVLEAIKNDCTHPCAEKIYLEAQKSEPKISRGTVYRNLHLLVSDAEIQHANFFGVDRYDQKLEPHYHLICTECGKVCNLDNVPYIADLDQKLDGHLGFKVQRHQTVFEGVCSDCQKK